MNTKTTYDLEIDYSIKCDDILTPQAIEFLCELHLKFNDKRLNLLEKRNQRQIEFNQGILPNFDPLTKNIRESNWIASETPNDLKNRRVEITGPVDRKMIINALNSGACTFMADFEDSNSPTWENTIKGQRNLKDAVRKTIYLKTDKKEYKLNDKTATLIVRPRGLHLEDKNITLENKNFSGSLIDFGLYFFHNIEELIKQNSATYFYIPKLEHYEEARWWNEVFNFSEEYLNINKGTIKTTVLIETITASFYLNEIIYELKNYIVGLNCGRWDYIFSYIKKLQNQQDFHIPDRDQITMTSPFMQTYSLAVVDTCHKRKIHAMGGMAAQIPIKNNPEANEIAYQKVRNDKEREVKNGHDGTWVAHPDLVIVAKEIFDKYMPENNQINKILNINITQNQLLQVPKGEITEQGIRKNINVGILYLESWLDGKGAAALYNLMEDAATAEISRTQIWLWNKRRDKTNSGQEINPEFINQLIDSEINNIKEYVGNEYYKNGKFKLAIQLFKEFIFNENLDEFLTLNAYKYI